MSGDLAGGSYPTGNGVTLDEREGQARSPTLADFCRLSPTFGPSPPLHYY